MSKPGPAIGVAAGDEIIGWVGSARCQDLQPWLGKCSSTSHGRNITCSASGTERFVHIDILLGEMDLFSLVPRSKNSAKLPNPQK